MWTQGTRSVNNDLALVHEQALLDVAAGQVFLRDRGFDAVVTLGHSGGGTLFAFYHQQASLPAATADLPRPGWPPDGPGRGGHAGPRCGRVHGPASGSGRAAARLHRPLGLPTRATRCRCDPNLDLYDPANGFADAPASSTYAPEFLARYRHAQRERIARIDAIARDRVAEASTARKAFAATGDPADRRAALAPRVLTVYRTDADPHGVDLSIDPERPALRFAVRPAPRPDRTTVWSGSAASRTPEAWLSTWSALSTNADFLRCAPGVTAPTLLIELTGDQACFPADMSAMASALGAQELTSVRVPGTHFGGPLKKGGPTGSSLAAAEIGAWLAARYPVGSVTG